ncbi:hypothetical protein JXA32_04730 [Candidatus Sumerlaeota bacterium]|nr:hypothetical protein [Candidatus Sumerlaeota bacterium]
MVQTIAAILIIIGLVFWASNRAENKRWGKTHEQLCRFVRGLIHDDDPLIVMAEFERRIWHGRKYGDRYVLAGVIPLCVYLDTRFDDLKELERRIVRQMPSFEEENKIPIDDAELLIKDVWMELKRGTAEEWFARLDAEEAEEPIEDRQGAFGMDVIERALKRYVACHYLAWKQYYEELDVEEFAQQALSKSRDVHVMFRNDQRIVLVRGSAKNEKALAEYLERVIQRLLGQRFEVALHA